MEKSLRTEVGWGLLNTNVGFGEVVTPPKKNARDITFRREFYSKHENGIDPPILNTPGGYGGRGKRADTATV